MILIKVSCPSSVCMSFQSLIEINPKTGGVAIISFGEDEDDMKIKLHITKESKTLLESGYDVSDANSFGEACADAYSRLRSKELRETSNVGEMMDMVSLNVLEILDGAMISITKA